MAVCAEGHEVPAGARFCGRCGGAVPQFVPPPVRLTEDPRIIEPPPTGRRSDDAIALAGRTIGMYAIVGAALGVSTLVFLWAIGFFDATTSIDEDLGTVVAGGVTVGLVLLFGLLMALVLAAFTAIYVSGRATSRGESFAISFASAAIGYVVLTALLGTLVIGGVRVFNGPGRPDTTSRSDNASLTIGDVGHIGLGGLPGLIIASAAAPLLYDRRRLPA